MNKIMIAASAAGALLAAPAAGQPGYPSIYGYPAQNGYPTGPADQGRSGYQNGTAYPGQSGYQNGPTYPGQNGYQSGPDYRGQSGYQDDGYGEPSDYDPGSGYADPRNTSAGFDARIGQIEARLDAAAGNGAIDSREASRLRAELGDIRRVERRYGYHRMGPQQRAQLQQRLAGIGQEIRGAEGRGTGGYGGYAGDRYGAGSGRYDNAGGYYQGSDSGYGRGEENDGRAGGYDSPVGAYSGNGGTGYGSLRVGQRVTGSLYGVPYQFRDRYRDGNGVYYRSDGRAIYRIDSRTGTVIGVYGMDD